MPQVLSKAKERRRNKFNMFNFGRLKEIENRILENQKTLGELNEGTPVFSSLFSDTEIKRIENCNKALEKERQHILDGRNSWKSKIFWDVSVPIIVAVITTYLINKMVF